MSFRLVDNSWYQELAGGLKADHSSLHIVCPFIKHGALKRVLGTTRLEKIRVITRFNLEDFASGVSDISALRLLLRHGAQIRGVRNLHAKLYLFGVSRAIVTSANLTNAGLSQNHELGFLADDSTIVAHCRKYFDDLWSHAGIDLTTELVEDWDEKVSQYLALGARADKPSGLGDEGTEANNFAVDAVPAPSSTDYPQAYVKFLGDSHSRKPLSLQTLDEIKRAGCHWAATYPAKKRPTGVKDGALIFFGRLTQDPNDIRIFGRAIGIKHKGTRDNATPNDIKTRPWKKKWPRYLRVHHAEFLSGSMSNGVSLNKLMNSLGALSFASTKRNAAMGAGNTNPRIAYRQLPAVELSSEGHNWLYEQLEAAFVLHGKLSPKELSALDWPV